MNIKYIEKIIVLVNNVWKYDTYIMDSDITENKVREFILSNNKKYKIKDVKYKFHGGPPMGTVMYNYKEIEGENVWIVNLKPDINYILSIYLQSFLKQIGVSSSIFFLEIPNTFTVVYSTITILKHVVISFTKKPTSYFLFIIKNIATKKSIEKNK